MKKEQFFSIIIILFFSLTTSSCFLFEDDEPKEEDMVPENWLDHSYLGTLTIRFTNVYPEWDESTQMDVEIEKELGTIEFESATLSYSGETLISDDSKIIRAGSWNIAPTGVLEGDGEIERIAVDANVLIPSDVQKIYALDNSGNWQLVSEVDFASSPNSDLVFNLDDAVISGSVVSASSELGSITWTLRLTPALD